MVPTRSVLCLLSLAYWFPFECCLRVRVITLTNFGILLMFVCVSHQGIPNYRSLLAYDQHYTALFSVPLDHCLLTRWHTNTCSVERGFLVFPPNASPPQMQAPDFQKKESIVGASIREWCGGVVG